MRRGARTARGVAGHRVAGAMDGPSSRSEVDRGCLLADVLPLLTSVEGFTHIELLRTMSCCKALHQIRDMPLDLGRDMRGLSARNVLNFVGKHAGRFMLRDVHVNRCDQAGFEALLALPGLRSLCVRPPREPDGLCIRSLAALRTARSLATLRLLQSTSLTLDGLDAVATCPSLSELSLTRTMLDAAELLSARTRLRSLELRRCNLNSSTTLDGLAEAGSAATWSLEHLALTAHGPPLDLAPLVALRILATLDLSLCVGIVAAGALGRCASLRVLTLTGCTALADLGGLDESATLETVYLTGCASLADASPLAACASLVHVHLNKCAKVRDVGAFGACERLRLLNIRCSGAVVVPQRSGLEVIF